MDWREIVSAINADLKAGEPGNISKDAQSGYLGYDPQIVIDAVNEHLGPDRWRYETVAATTEEIISREGKTSRKMEFVGRLFVRLDSGEWLTHGDQYGGATAGRDNTDGRKAAVTDFLKKSFAWWGIGNRPYRGELPDPDKKPYKAPGATQSGRPTQPTTQTPKAPPPPPDGQETAAGETIGQTKYHVTQAAAKIGPDALRDYEEQHGVKLGGMTMEQAQAALYWFNSSLTAIPYVDETLLDDDEELTTHEKVRALLETLAPGDPDVQGNILESVTAFDGKDGPVKGKRDVSKLSERAAPVVLGKLRKLLE